jgi:hypothetical protein
MTSRISFFRKLNFLLFLFSATKFGQRVEMREKKFRRFKHRRCQIREKESMYGASKQKLLLFMTDRNYIGKSLM